MLQSAFHRHSHPHEFGPLNQQLSQIALLRRRRSESWKPQWRRRSGSQRLTHQRFARADAAPIPGIGRCWRGSLAFGEDIAIIYSIEHSRRKKFTWETDRTSRSCGLVPDCRRAIYSSPNCSEYVAYVASISPLILTHNKPWLRSSIMSSSRSSHNAVEYFVSHYDYYQPEAYIPQPRT
jgi:hypothetical protein